MTVDKRVLLSFNVAIAISFLFPLFVFAQVNLPYQTPAESIRELVEAPSTPSINFNKKGDKYLLLEKPDLMIMEDVAQQVIGLAGLRINPSTNTQTVASFYTGISIHEVESNKKYKIAGLPAHPKLSNITWSPDENFIAFTNSSSSGLELWLIDVNSLSAKMLSSQYVNGSYGSLFEWSSDSKNILVKLIQKDRGELPKPNLTPSGPIIQENYGKAAPSRTYQYLLQNTYDTELLDYFLTSQLELVSVNGTSKPIGKPAIYKTINYSPDGKYIFAQTIQKPYSYLVPIYSFPFTNEIWDDKGMMVKDLGMTASAENLPIGSDVVAKGPRSYNWRPDQAATLYWVEAMDGGNPNEKVKERDAVYTLSAPFSEQPKPFANTTLRYASINWTTGDYAVLNERWRKTRKEKSSLLNSKTGELINIIADRASEDAYTDPGNFVYTTNSYNRNVLLMDKGNTPIVFTISTGASPEGDRPFLLKWDLITGKTDTLFKSQSPNYELPIKFSNKGSLIISSESNDVAPNYFTVSIKNKRKIAITDFENPYPSLIGISKQQLSYPRKDGVILTGTLYRAKEYEKLDGPLPMLLWAYPREFKSAEAASQVKGSPHRFTRLSWGSPIYWVTRGYAILDNADMPIVGEDEKEPNDTFVTQIQDNAAAAINYVADLGVVDPNRVAVGGHSYGAFMTANLLSHTKLFAAGIARSGAYNRTFTPFGFQAEERTYWQAPDVYYNMSPFSFADKIKTPILFIHGMDDENSGTFPIQSERLYNAIKGHGGTTRLVMLPKEFHSYRAKESILHTLWEMDKWLEKHVKNK